MGRKQGIRRALALPGAQQRVPGAVEEEIAFHLEERTRQLIATGMDPEAAREMAVREFGDVRLARAELTEIDRRLVRQSRRADWWQDLRQDLRFAVRSAVRAPLFSLLAVLTLTLGIGANAAVFGVLKSVLLDALPYRDADRLMRVHGHHLEEPDQRGPLSAGSVRDIADRQRSFESVAAFQSQAIDAVHGGDDGPRVAKVAWVEPGVFRTLGVSPTLGRVFRSEDVSPDTAHVILLSHGAWQRLFGGDPSVLGRDVRINGIPREVIGVLPSGFVGPWGEADFHFALNLEPVLANPVSARRSHWLGMVGRLGPGITPEAGRRELTAIGADLAREYPADNGSIGFTGVSLRDAMVGDTRTPLLVLMASAGLVLLIACANLAGAFLSRALTRRKEFAVRVALGAGRGRLIRQLLTESTLLAVIGGAAALLLAALGLRVLRGLALPALPTYAELALDPGAVAVIALLALATGLAFGVVPAFSVSRSDPQQTLRDETRGASERGQTGHLRGLLVAAQIALCISLVSGAALLTRSLWAMTNAPLGFDPENTLTMAVQLPGAAYGTPEAQSRFYEQFAERLRALPGVEGTASVSMLPTAVLTSMGISIDGAPPPPDDAQPFVLYATVSDDYFRTLRIAVREGRTFDERDRLDAPPTVVISEATASRFWPRGDALGSRIRLGPNPNAPWMEVIGVVADVRNDLSRPDAEPIAYRSNRQQPWPFSSFVVRTRSDPTGLVNAVRREIAVLDPSLPLDRVMPLREVVGEGLSGQRLPAVLMAAFGVLALLLASVGVYALFASMAAAREREFGVRIALGATRRGIAALVLRQGAVWMVVGLAGGALGVFAITRLVRTLLYGIAPFDPLAIAFAVVMLIACGTIALLAPVRRATRVDPITALR
ncbi:MAG TPA: ABC transporter permease [Gemmatimonadaceae bacterium]|nr:ABC transporter permease [Gemmatimonadaceae bacterium]